MVVQQMPKRSVVGTPVIAWLSGLFYYHSSGCMSTSKPQGTPGPLWSSRLWKIRLMVVRFPLCRVGAPSMHWAHRTS